MMIISKKVFTYLDKFFYKLDINWKYLLKHILQLGNANKAYKDFKWIRIDLCL